ncbi:MAG: SDR family NAD(P)-dependent oxidoreductase [Bacteroidota bacterium]|nr:SDR family NAD(P)-dependent oxidoreductase [Bacteroidota bacterium]
MNILVTGGAGFIGSHLCEQLLKENHKVICLDNFDEFYSKVIKQENIKELKENPKFHLITGDVRNTDDLIDIMTSKKIEAVFHLAGRSGGANSIKNPTEFISTNVQGTISLLEAMREAEIDKLVFTSSSSVYGNVSTAPFTETTVLGTPTTTYAATKQSAESLIRMYHELYQFSAIVLRIFSVYGPKQRPDSGIYQFVKSNLKNAPLNIYTEGKIMRDYTFISDIIPGLVSSLKYLVKNEETPIHDTFNLGSGSPIDVNGVLDIIENTTGTPFVKNFKKAPVGNMHASYAEISKAKKTLNYAPKVSLTDGIKEVISWMKPLV